VSDTPAKLYLTLLCRMERKLDVIGADVWEVGQRMGSAARQMADVRSDLAGLAGRCDRLDLRMERIEHRLGRADA
jgi:hypothetical protein